VFGFDKSRPGNSGLSKAKRRGKNDGEDMNLTNELYNLLKELQCSSMIQDFIYRDDESNYRQGLETCSNVLMRGGL
jgi:hypothetical protein